MSPVYQPDAFEMPYPMQNTEQDETTNLNDTMTGVAGKAKGCRVGESFERRLALESAIERVLYQLGNTYARNSMQSCNCPAQVRKPVDIYCIDLLSK